MLFIVQIMPKYNLFGRFMWRVIKINQFLKQNPVQVTSQPKYLFNFQVIGAVNVKYKK